jgi:hypothetical protein
MPLYGVEAKVSNRQLNEDRYLQFIFQTRVMRRRYMEMARKQKRMNCLGLVEANVAAAKLAHRNLKMWKQRRWEAL